MTRTRRVLALTLGLLVVAAAVPVAMTETTAAAEVGEMTVMTAPAAASTADAEAVAAASVTDDTIAASDKLVLRLNATNIGNETDNQSVLGGGVQVDVSQSNGDGSLDVSADSDATSVVLGNDTLYVVVDLSNTSAEAGQSYDVTATVSGDLSNSGEVTKSGSFEVVEPRLSFSNESLSVPKGAYTPVSGNTTLAPGTQVILEVQSANGGGGSTVQTTVGPNGTFSGSISVFTFDTGDQFTINASAAGVSNVSAQLSGQVVEATQTTTDGDANGTDATTTTSETGADGTGTTDESNGTGTTGETESTTPGFGAAVAVLALLGLAFVAGRRD